MIGVAFAAGFLIGFVLGYVACVLSTGWLPAGNQETVINGLIDEALEQVRTIVRRSFHEIELGLNVNATPSQIACARETLFRMTTVRPSDHLESEP